jgi:hypothetical protein
MAPINSNLREFGKIISGNRRAKAEIPESTRSAIISAVKCGESQSEVARCFQVSRKTVFNTIQRFHQQNDFKSRSKSGRPRKYNDRTRRYVYLLVCRNPCLSWVALEDLAPGGLSKLTIRRILCKYKTKKWKSQK